MTIARREKASPETDRNNTQPFFNMSLKIIYTLAAIAISVASVCAQNTQNPEQNWPKKVKLLRETHLVIHLGSTTARRKMPSNTEVDVVNE